MDEILRTINGIDLKLRGMSEKLEELAKELKRQREMMTELCKAHCAMPDNKDDDFTEEERKLSAYFALPKYSPLGDSGCHQVFYATFKKVPGGGDWWYGQNILFLGARHLGDYQDLLTEYLESYEVRSAIAKMYNKAMEEENVPEKVEVSIVDINLGAMEYDGVPWWYWLKGRDVDSVSFNVIGIHGDLGEAGGKALGGVVIKFRVVSGE